MCCVGSHVAMDRDVGGMAVSYVPSSKWRILVWCTQDGTDTPTGDTTS
jgi:hypothetical protein